ncbi:hypothetical protein GCM10009113_03930 [Marinobacter szutsaonensis]
MHDWTELQNRLVEGLPGGIILRAATEFRDHPSEFGIEEARVVAAVEKRKNEYRTGRNLARQALANLGIQPCAIPSGPKGEPCWPPGIVGSISHCKGLCLAAVAPESTFHSIGVDVELNKPLPAGIPEMIFSAEECLRHPHPNLISCLDTLTFSAKESVFKCLFPIVGFYFDFKEVSLTFQTRDRHFMAQLPERIATTVGFDYLDGKYAEIEDYIVTFAYLKASGNLRGSRGPGAA